VLSARKTSEAVKVKKVWNRRSEERK